MLEARHACWSLRRLADIDKVLESQVPSDSIGVNYYKGKFESKIQSRNVALNYFLESTRVLELLSSMFIFWV